MNDYTSTTRLLTKIVRDVATAQRFASYTDLKDVLRRRLLTLRIRYQQQEFDDAVNLVASNLALCGLRLVQSPILEQPAPCPLSRGEAKRLYDDLWRRYRIEHPQPQPPTPVQVFTLVPVARW